jgi:NitT/TauT family transport system substrate-binding protein
MKREIMLIVAVGVIFLTTAAAGCIQSSGEKELTKAKFAWFKGGTVIPQYVAQDKGYFEDEGLDVEIVHFKSTADAIPVVAAGDIEFGMTSNAPVLKAIESGAPIKAIGVALYYSADEGHKDIAYVALEESGIKSVDDLKGKRIAIPYVGGDSHAYIVGILKKHGISPDEVTFVTVPWPYQIDALVKGEVDAAGLFSTHMAEMEMEGINYTIVASAGDLLPHIDVVVVYSSTDYIKEHPDVVRKFLRAFYRGQTYLKTHPEGYRKYLADYTGLEPELIEKLDIEKFQGVPTDGKFNEAFWQDFTKIMIDAGFLEEEIPLDRIFTEEYLPDGRN